MSSIAAVRSEVIARYSGEDNSALHSFLTTFSVQSMMVGSLALCKADKNYRMTYSRQAGGIPSEPLMRLATIQPL